MGREYPHTRTGEVMSITVTDPALFARWAEMRGVIELKDPSGHVVGRIQTTWPAPFPKDAREGYPDHVSDPDLLARFEKVGEPVIVFDSQGYNIGRLERMWHVANRPQFAALGT